MNLRRPAIFTFFLLVAWKAPAQLFFEDFSGETNGDVSGTAVGGTWSVTTTPSGGAASYSRQTNLLGNGVFRANDTGSEGVWTSSAIDISGTGVAVISVTMVTIFTNATDYIRLSYIVDGGPETQFAELLGQTFSVSTAGSAIVTGSSLTVIIRSMDNTAGSFLGQPNSMRFDDVTVSAVTRLYSRQTGTWNDNTAPGTWSTTGHAGADCLCTPNANSLVYIGAGHVVSLSAAGTTGGLVIENTALSELRYTAGTSLTISGGLLEVQSGSVGINRNAQAGSSIIFNVAIPVAVTVNAPITTDDMQFSAGSVVTVSGSSTITLSDDLMFNAGSSSATLNNSIVFTITDDVVDNAILSLTNLSIVNNSGATLSFADLDLTGPIGNHSNLRISNSGTINQSGNFSNIDNGSDFENLSTGVWNWSLTPNTTYDTDLNTVLDCSTAGNTFNYSANGAQRIIPVTYHHLNLSTAGAKDANNASWSVAGNWTVSGTASFTEGTGTITLSGTSDQTITNASGETFNNLTINKSAGQVLLATGGSSTDIMIAGTLTFTSGIIQSTASELVIFNAGSVRSGGSSTSHVDGPVRKVGNTAFTFPTGDGGEYRTIAITAPGLATDHFTAQFYSTPQALGSTLGVGIAVVSACEYWDLNRTNGASNVSVTLSWVSAECPNTYVADLPDLRVSRWTGALWTDHGNGGTTGTAASGTVVSSAAVTTFGSFALASSTLDNPLPVTLTGFEATPLFDHVRVSWQTSSELNNDFFTLERSPAGELFEELVRIPGAGTSPSAHDYVFEDWWPVNGRSFYRLKQTDFDGTFTYSEVVRVDLVLPPLQRVFPNPVSEYAQFEMNGAQPGRLYSLRIVDLNARQFGSAEVVADDAGWLRAKLDFTQMPAGVYLIQTSTPLTPVRVVKQ
jgi:hypothetical protein